MRKDKLLTATLAATALFMTGVNVACAENVSTWEGLRTGLTNGGNFTVTGDIDGANSVILGQTSSLNLGGYTLSGASEATSGFSFNAQNLTLIGGGTIRDFYRPDIDPSKVDGGEYGIFDLRNNAVLSIEDGDWIFSGNTSGIGSINTLNSTVSANVDKIVFKDNVSNAQSAGLRHQVSDNTYIGTSVTITANEIIFDNNEIKTVGDLGTAKVGSGAAVMNCGGTLNLYGKENTFKDNEMNATIDSGRTYKVGGGAVINQSHQMGNNGPAINSVMVIGKADGSSTNTFTGNTSSTNGGAIMNRAVDDDGDATLTINGNTTFENNTATKNGGAIYNIQHVGRTATVNLNNGSYAFNNNLADAGGAIYNEGNLTITGSSSFKGNSAKGSGGAIYNNGGQLAIGNASFEGNALTGSGKGGAIYNSSTQDSSVSNSVFSGNYTKKSGDGIVGSGGAIYNHSVTGKLTLDNDIFSNNGMIIDEEGHVTVKTKEGGAIYNASGTIDIKGGSIINNFAKCGGAIYNKATVNIEGITISGNAASDPDGGGAIFNKGTITLTGINTFADNTANNVANDIYNNGILYINGTTNLNGGISGTGTINLGASSVTSMLGEETTGSSSIEAATINITEGAKISFDWGDTITADAIDAAAGVKLGVDRVHVDKTQIADGANFNLFTEDKAFVNLDADRLTKAYSGYKDGSKYTLAQDGTDQHIIKMVKGVDPAYLTKAVYDTTDDVQTVDYELSSGGETYGSSLASDEQRTIGKNTEFEINGTSATTDIIKASDANTKGIIVDQTAVLTVNNAQFDDFQADSNGAIENHGTLNLNNSIMGSNNTVAVLNAANATLNINDSVIRSTILNYGKLVSDPSIYNAGVMNYKGAEFTVDGDTFQNIDRTGEDGGAIYNEAADSSSPAGIVTLNNIKAYNNIADKGGVLYNAGTATVTGGDFGFVDMTDPANPVYSDGNSADQGGAIFNDENATLSIDGANFYNNTATSTDTNAGGGAIKNVGGTITIKDSYFIANTSAADGGAIVNTNSLDSNGSLSISNSTFSANESTNNGGAISNTGTLTVTDSSFDNNSATGSGALGGAIYSTGNVTINAVGSAVAFSGNTVGTTPVYNDIYMLGASESSPVTLALNAKDDTNTISLGGGIDGQYYDVNVNAATGNAGAVSLGAVTGANNLAISTGTITADKINAAALNLNGGTLEMNTGKDGIEVTTLNTVAGTTLTSNGDALTVKNGTNAGTITGTSDFTVAGTTGTDVYTNSGTIANGVDIKSGTLATATTGLTTTSSIKNGDVLKFTDTTTATPVTIAQSIEKSTNGGTVEIAGGANTVFSLASGKSITNQALKLTSGTYNAGTATGDVDLTNFTSIIANSGTLSVQDDQTGTISLGTINTDASALKIAIDADLAGSTGDLLSLTSESGTDPNNIQISSIKAISDPTATEFEFQIADDSAKAHIDMTSTTITSEDGLTPAIGNLLLTYDSSSGKLKGTHTNLANAITSTVPTKVYAMTASSTEQIGALTLGGTSLSITGNGATIASTITPDPTAEPAVPAINGITLGAATQELKITGATIGNTTNYFATAIDNTIGGTVNLTDVTFTGNTTDVANAGALNFNNTGDNTNSVNTITGAGTMNVKSGSTTVNTSLAQGTVNVGDTSVDPATNGTLISKGALNVTTLDVKTSDSKFTNEGGTTTTPATIGTLTNAGTVENKGQLSATNINNNNVLTNAADSKITSTGGIMNTGSITNAAAGSGTGSVAGEIEANITNNLAAATLDNQGHITGNVTNTLGTVTTGAAGITGDVTNDDKLVIQGATTGTATNLSFGVTNSTTGITKGTTFILGSVNTPAGVAIMQATVNVGDNITDPSSPVTGALSIAAGVPTSGSVTADTINVISGSVLNNGGNVSVGTTLANAGTVSNAGLISGAGSVDNDGTLSTTASSVTVTGGIDNDGTVNLSGSTTTTADVLGTSITSTNNTGVTNIKGNVATGNKDIAQNSVVVGNDGATAVTGSKLTVGAGTDTTANTLSAGSVSVTAGNTLALDKNSKSAVTGAIAVATGGNLDITDNAGLTAGSVTITDGNLNLNAATTDLALTQAVTGAGTNGVTVNVTSGNDGGTPVTTYVASVEAAITNAVSPVNVAEGSILALNDGGTITSDDGSGNQVGTTIALSADTTGANGADLTINSISGRTFDNDVTATAGSGSKVDVNAAAGKTVVLANSMIGVDKVNANTGITQIGATGDTTKTSTSATLGTADLNIASGATATIDATDTATTNNSYTIDNDIDGTDGSGNLVLSGNTPADTTTPTKGDVGTTFSVASGTQVINAAVDLQDGQLNVDDGSAFATSTIAAAADTTINAMNGTSSTFNNITFADDSMVKADVDVASKVSDNFSGATGSVVLTDVNIANLDKIVVKNTDMNLKEYMGLPNLTISDELAGQKFQAMTPIRIMEATLDQTGMLNVHPSSGNNDWRSYNPAVMVGPIAAQIGGYLTQLNSYDQAFANMDMYMMMTKKQRQALKMKNKIASIEGGNIAFDPTMRAEDHAGGWFRPYATFEKVHLHNAPKVENTAYGSFFGGESSMKDLGNGWDGMWGAYVGYNGSHQSYTGTSIYQNGGTLGLVGMAYKDNFFVGTTINVGANAGEADSYFGNEHFSMLMAGIAAKTGYNWELADGKFIIQPALQMSYSFVNTFNYTNAAGVRISSNPLNAIQLEPGVKFIGNLKNGWQPYAGVSVVINLMDRTSFQANDITLPHIGVNPFVKYGVGVRKSWGERLTGFFQTFLMSGGRAGIGFNAGFRWSIGKAPSSIGAINGKTPDMDKAKVNLTYKK